MTMICDFPSSAILKHERVVEPSVGGVDGREHFQPGLLCPRKTRRQRDVIAHPQRLEPSILGGAGPTGENVGCDPWPPMQAKQPEFHSMPPVLAESTGSHTGNRQMPLHDRG